MAISIDSERPQQRWIRIIKNASEIRPEDPRYGRAQNAIMRAKEKLEPLLTMQRGRDAGLELMEKQEALDAGPAATFADSMLGDLPSSMFGGRAEFDGKELTAEGISEGNNPVADWGGAGLSALGGVGGAVRGVQVLRQSPKALGALGFKRAARRAATKQMEEEAAELAARESLNELQTGGLKAVQFAREKALRELAEKRAAEFGRRAAGAPAREAQEEALRQARLAATKTSQDAMMARALREQARLGQQLAQGSTKARRGSKMFPLTKEARELGNQLQKLRIEELMKKMAQESQP